MESKGDVSIPLTLRTQLKEFRFRARATSVPDRREQAALQRCVRRVARAHCLRMLPGREARLHWLESRPASLHTVDRRGTLTCPFHLFHRASQRRLGSPARTSFEPVDFVIDHGRGHHDAYSAGSCQRIYARAYGCRQRPRRHREELIESERRWSGREAFVTMMQTADLGQGNDRSRPGRLNGSSIRCVLAERQVGP